MGSSEEIYWNMAKNNRKLDAKMPSFFCHNLFIMNCLLVEIGVSEALPPTRLKINYSDFIA